MKYLLYILVCVCSFRGYGQMVVSLLHENSIYIGVDNPIDFAVKGVNPNTIELKASYGELKKTEDGKIYMWHACDRPSRRFYFYAVEKGTGRTIDSVEYRVRYFQGPDVHMACNLCKSDFMWEICCKSVLWKTEGFLAAFDNIDYDYRCSIEGYRITFRFWDGAVIHTENKGAMYTDRNLKLLKKFADRDTVIFDNFEVQCGCETVPRMSYKRFTFIEVDGSVKKEETYSYPDN